jgi:hypothetical protein
MTNYRPFASIGAFLALAQLIVSPLAQNALIYPLETVAISNSQGAHTSTTTRWFEEGQGMQTSPNANETFVQYSAISMGMKGAVQKGLFSFGETIPPLTPSCVSGNCTLGYYQTLGVCSSSANITSSLRKNETTRSLPGGLSVPHGGNVIATMASVANPPSQSEFDGIARKLEFSNSIAFKDIGSPIADVFMIYNNNGSFAAVEFVLQWCVLSLNSTVVNGTANTSIHGDYRNFSVPEKADLTAWMYKTTDGTLTPADPNDHNNIAYSIEAHTHDSLQRYMYDLLRGTITIIGAMSYEFRTTTDAVEAIYAPLHKLPTDGLPSDNTGKVVLDKLLGAMATSMTNQMRTKAQDQTFLGTVIRQRTVVRVQWGFLIAPIVFTVLCILFASATLVYQSVAGPKSMRLHVWKSSSLAVLHALEPDLQQRLSGMVHPSTLQQQAQRIMVELNVAGEEHGEWRLTGVNKEEELERTRPHRQRSKDAIMEARE